MTLPAGRHFLPEEFASKAGHGVPREEYPEHWADRWASLVALCDAIRDAWGGPLLVVSGYRSPAYNAALIEADEARGAHGVAQGSFHMQGIAADLEPATGDASALHRRIVEEYEAGRLPTLGGLGLYPRSGWCHVDLHKAADGHLRRWLGN